MRGCHLVRTYAVANLEDVSTTIPSVEKKRKRTAGNPEGDIEHEDGMESKGDDTPETTESGPMPIHDQGLEPAGKEGDDTIETLKDTPKPRRPRGQPAGEGAPKPVMVRGKVLPPRSPQPARRNRNTHPGLIDKPKAKKTSAEVTMAAERRADLEQQARELAQQHMETLAIMELEEELNKNAEEHTVVRKQAKANSFEIEMQSDDREDANDSFDDARSRTTSEDETVEEQKVAPKQKKV
jgi:hypothetical protein